MFSNLVFAYELNFILSIVFLKQFYIPAVLTLLPLIIIVRWTLGRYSQKRIARKKIEIKGSGNYDNLRINFNDLVYIKSSDNYIEVLYLESGIIKKAIIRALLKNIEKTFPNLLRTHRSYLINPFHFKQWNSGKNKLEVILKNDITIPVSKTYIENVKHAINSTTKKQ
ncbi:LytTR family DNA-binding domain-containing protein [Lacinutrix sp.]|uniref:LytR/AlgR family response regulator transcription factor n=1 Tax=Lacinutrix sp. TaxID=1937692 RepID=UPI0025B7E67B|nr:LytTR family DNA-binding domain-containing protein [Lacinutrix sp.]